eukprot:m.68656 g.68656  ORF g.68656 m.68656 type:complete len:613 (+) comp35539_c0_seq2:22-1860(+)
MEGTAVVCGLAVQKMSGSAVGNKARQVDLVLMRGDKGDLILKVNEWDKKFILQDVRLHKRFVSEGKATIVLVNQGLQLLISNCPSRSLAHFLRTVEVKLASARQRAAPGQKMGQLRRLANQSFAEISPVNATDVRVFRNRTNSPSTPGRSRNDGRIPKRKLGASSSPQPPTKKCSRLSEEQMNVVSMVRQGKNVFFTGSAGTGKSLVLKHVIGLLPPESTFVCGSTGIAACHVGGTTLHNFAGIGLGEGSLSHCIAKASRRASYERWWQCKHLVIDEISMIDANYFDKLEGIGRAVKKSAKPFGGIQLILCGDFLQLPPVSREGQEKFCFQVIQNLCIKFIVALVVLCIQAECWEECIDITLVLKQVHRQTDVKFIKILQRLRIGRCPDVIVDLMRSTCDNKIEHDGIKATRLSTHNESVELINNTELTKLPGESRTFIAVDSEVFPTDKDCAIKSKLELKPGAQVMLTKNLDVSRGLVNGARGVVVEFSAKQRNAPVVKFASGQTIVIKPEKWTFGMKSGVPVTRRQLPLKLAWALSIHKSQGMTLDCVEVSLSRAFACGQAYVALSRAKSLDGLRVIDFDKSCVQADRTVLQYYEELNDGEGLGDREVDH